MLGRKYFKNIGLFSAIAIMTCSIVNAAEMNLPVSNGVTGATLDYNGADATTGTRLDVNVNSAVADVTYDSFNIGTARTVNFDFSTAGQVALNRVTVPGNPSVILGNITNSGAAGKVFLLNPNGILFGSNSSVNLNSFMGTTHDYATSYADINAVIDDVQNNNKILLERTTDNGLKIDQGSVFDIDKSLALYSGNIIMSADIQGTSMVDLIGCESKTYSWTGDSINSMGSTSFGTLTLSPSNALFSDSLGNLATISGHNSALLVNGSVAASQVSAMAKVNLAEDLNQLVNIDGVVFADSTLGDGNGNIRFYGENINVAYDGGLIFQDDIITENGIITVNSYIASGNKGSNLEIADDVTMKSGGTGEFRLDVNDSSVQSGDITIGDNVNLDSGGSLLIYSSVDVAATAGDIIIGDNVSLNSKGAINLLTSAKGSTGLSGKVTIGDNFSVDTDSSLEINTSSYGNSNGGIEIGDNASIKTGSYQMYRTYSHWYASDSSLQASFIIGDNATLLSDDYINTHSTNYRYQNGDTIIGNNAYIKAKESVQITSTGDYGNGYNGLAGNFSLGDNSTIISENSSVKIGSQNDGSQNAPNATIGDNVKISAADSIKVHSLSYYDGDGGVLTIGDNNTYTSTGGNIEIHASSYADGNGGTLNIGNDNSYTTSEYIYMMAGTGGAGINGTVNIGYDTGLGHFLNTKSYKTLYWRGPLTVKQSISNLNFSAGEYSHWALALGSPDIMYKDTYSGLTVSTGMTNLMGTGDIIYNSTEGVLLKEDIDTTKNVTFIYEKGELFDLNSHIINANNSTFELNNNIVSSNGGVNMVVRSNGELIANGMFSENYKAVELIKNNGEVTTLYNEFPDHFLSTEAENNSSLTPIDNLIDNKYEHSRNDMVGLHALINDDSVEISIDNDINIDDCKAGLAENRNKIVSDEKDDMEYLNINNLVKNKKDYNIDQKVEINNIANKVIDFKFIKFIY